MDVRLAQLGGMVKYEFKMHWRRRALRILTLSLAAIAILVALLRSGQFGESGSGVREFLIQEVERRGIDPSNQADALTFTILFTTWLPINATLALVMPLLFSDAIPSDRHYGTRELLDSAPLSRTVYLSGKLLGVWSAVLSGILLVVVLTGLAWRIGAGEYHVAHYVEMWLLGGSALVILNGGLGVLIAAGQTTRRRAVLLVAIFMILPTVFAAPTVQAIQLGGQLDALAYLYPLRTPMMMRYLDSTSTGFAFLSQDTVLTVGVGFMELALAWLIAWRWMNWQEGEA